MNGSQGITPTIELASANGNNGYAYPVYPMYNGGFGGNGLVVMVLTMAMHGYLTDKKKL